MTKKSHKQRKKKTLAALKLKEIHERKLQSEPDSLAAEHWKREISHYERIAEHYLKKAEAKKRARSIPG